jgi:hypothetical protein
LTGFGKAEAVLPYGDDKTADQIDKQDQHCGDGIAAHEFAGAIHRAKKIRLLRHLPPAACRFFLVDQPGIEIGIDGHLLAGHTVEHEARGNFRNAPGAFGNHDKIDDHQDRENGDTDRIIAADDKAAESLDNAARRTRSQIAVEQDDPGGGDVQRQPQQCRQQKQGRERREIGRFCRVERCQQDHQRE